MSTSRCGALAPVVPLAYPLADVRDVRRQEIGTVQTRHHGFTRVDEDVRPTAWVECLDKLHSEPFYREYKARVRAILSPRPTGLYLEVGAGVGTDAMAIGAEVIGIDRSLTMCRESRARGLEMSVVADAEALPLPSGLVDGCWSDRTFQHLADPRRAFGELIRDEGRSHDRVSRSRLWNPSDGVSRSNSFSEGIGISRASCLAKRYTGTADEGAIRRSIPGRRVCRGEGPDRSRPNVRRQCDGSSILGTHRLYLRYDERRRSPSLGAPIRRGCRRRKFLLGRFLFHHEWAQACRPT